MNEVPRFSFDDPTRLVRSVCEALMTLGSIFLAISILLGLLFVVLVIEVLSISASSAGMTSILVFALILAIPSGAGATLISCSKRISRGQRNAVIVALVLSIVLLVAIGLITLGSIWLIVDVFVLSKDSGIDVDGVACAMPTTVVLTFIWFVFLSIVRKLRRCLPILHLISGKSISAFPVLPVDRSDIPLANESNEPIDNWPEIESDDD